MQSTQGKMLEMMKAVTTGGAGTATVGDLALHVSKIDKTLSVISELKTALGNLKKKKKQIATGDADGGGKMRKLTMKIKKKQQLISTLEATIEAKEALCSEQSEMAEAEGNLKDDADYEMSDNDSSDDKEATDDSNNDSD
jgi:hypothetical protein